MELSVAIPLYNEEKNVDELFRRLTKVVTKISKSFEFIVVDDGSTDKTLEKLIKISKKNSRLKILSLSRNFGHEAALTAAIDHSKGNIVISMDGDLQDSPEFIPNLISGLESGYDVAFAQHFRRSDPLFRKILFIAFYRFMGKLASYPIPLHAGSFSAMRRPVVNSLCQMTEHNRYISGLRAWVGYKQIAVEYEKMPRFAGTPQQTLSKLIRMGSDALFSFSYIPLRLATFLGLLVSFVAFIVIIDVLYQKLVAGTAIIGWASPLISILFIGGIQLIILGIVGEYIGRIYDEIKKRPNYIVKQKIGLI